MLSSSAQQQNALKFRKYKALLLWTKHRKNRLLKFFGTLNTPCQYKANNSVFTLEMSREEWTDSSK
jgi:hypothetical protein